MIVRSGVKFFFPLRKSQLLNIKYFISKNFVWKPYLGDREAFGDFEEALEGVFEALDGFSEDKVGSVDVKRDIGDALGDVVVTIEVAVIIDDLDDLKSLRSWSSKRSSALSSSEATLLSSSSAPDITA